jgi:hypothetical protein
MPVVRLHRLEQMPCQPALADPAGEIRRQILHSRLRERVRAGGRVAVAVGSRGIANFRSLVRATVDTLKDLGYRPFVVAAMGSHGGATAEGQRQLLASYGITPETIETNVSTAMEVVCLGRNSWDEPVYWDRTAYEADAVVTLSRIKPHTDFRGRFESGIVKMLVIGLGKREGAATHHQYGIRGLRDMMPESAKVVLARTRFALGLAILENAREQTALIQAVEPEELFEVEPRLLEQARSLVARLPVQQLDLLVVGELGKNYSGTGMDVHVLGRQMIETQADSWNPMITRICVLDLSEESHGNAVGLGLADLTTKKILARMDPVVTNLNSFTSCFLLRAKVPPAFDTDRECVEMGLRTCWQPRLERVRMAIIPNTLELTTLWVTPPVAEECHGRADLHVASAWQEIPWNDQGDLVQEELFPDSVRARRRRSGTATGP